MPNKNEKMNKTCHKQMKLTVILLLLLGFTGLHAQEAVPTAGGTVTGSGGSVSYTIGQIAYTVNSGTGGSVSQGVQQPYEIGVLTGLDDEWNINLIVKAYPNPATDYLILHLDNSDISGISYQLCDMNGRLLESQMVERSETTISMNLYVPSAYFLKVIQNNKEIKTFKIIKN